MHLERQLSFDRVKDQLERAAQQREKQLEALQTAHAQEKEALVRQIQERDGEIERLKGLFITLHNKFEDDK